MKTDDLIALLAIDDTPARPIAPRLLMQAGSAVLVAGAILLSILGIRPDLSAALADPVTVMKWVLPVAAGLPAAWVTVRLTRPQVRHVPAQFLVLAIAALALIWLSAAILSAPSGALWPTMRGNTAPICVSSITLIGLVPLIVGLRVLRDGASPRPARSGAMLGLASGGLAAALYALHCNEDAPLFFLTWYSLGILAVTALGAVLGRRQLRW